MDSWDLLSYCVGILTIILPVTPHTRQRICLGIFNESERPKGLEGTPSTEKEAQTKFSGRPKKREKRRVGNVDHGSWTSPDLSESVECCQRLKRQVTEDAKMPQGAEIIVDGVVRFDREANNE